MQEAKERTRIENPKLYTFVYEEQCGVPGIPSTLNVWSNGSIIKSNLINSLFKDYSVKDILSDKKIFKDLVELKPHLIKTLSSSLKNDVSIPCFNEGLNYFNQISNTSLSTKLIQAQRNYFGSHKIKINK